MEWVKKARDLLYEPRWIGAIYLSLVLIFGVTYWLTPDSWDEPLGFIQSIYFSVVTITTLGYGDITPLTDLSRILTGIESLLGILLIGLFLNALAHRLSDRENRNAILREYENWLPVKKLVLDKCLLVSDLMLSVLANISSDRDNGKNAASQNIGNAKYNLNKLHSLVNANSVGLGSNMLPGLMELLEKYDKLMHKCQYLMLKFDRQYANHEFVLHSPLKDLEQIGICIENLISEVPELGLKNDIQDRIDSIKQAWNTFITEKSILAVGESTKPTGDRPVHIFNLVVGAENNVTHGQMSVLSIYYAQTKTFSNFQ